MQARIYVTLKRTVLDPQGATVKNALESMGYSDVDDVRVGKYLEVRLRNSDPKKAAAEVEEMCRKLLVNPIIETFRYDLVA